MKNQKKTKTLRMFSWSFRVFPSLFQHLILKLGAIPGHTYHTMRIFTHQNRGTFTKGDCKKTNCSASFTSSQTCTLQMCWVLDFFWNGFWQTNASGSLDVKVDLSKESLTIVHQTVHFITVFSRQAFGEKSSCAWLPWGPCSFPIPNGIKWLNR